jgi:hypothetical protein
MGATRALGGDDSGHAIEVTAAAMLEADKLEQDPLRRYQLWCQVRMCARMHPSSHMLPALGAQVGHETFSADGMRRRDSGRARDSRKLALLLTAGPCRCCMQDVRAGARAMRKFHAVMLDLLAGIRKERPAESSIAAHLMDIKDPHTGAPCLCTFLPHAPSCHRMISRQQAESVSRKPACAQASPWTTLTCCQRYPSSSSRALRVRTAAPFCLVRHHGVITSVSACVGVGEGYGV